MPSLCSECGASRTERPASVINVAVALGTQQQKLLTTNTPPEGPELIFIRSVVAKADARLADIENEISPLHDRLRELEEERVSLSRYRAQNNAILSPLRRMPPEMLSEIFSWTLPSAVERLGRSKSDLSDSPWLLTQISSRWRAVALSTPSLWSLFVLDCESSFYSLPMLRAQLARAHMLRIHLYAHEDVNSRPQIEIFQLLIEHSPRWEELLIELTSDLFPLLSIVQGRLPSLRRLWIQWNHPESQEEAESIDCFLTAASLLEVSICNEHRHVSILLPSQQLTCYNLDAPWKVHRGILELAKNLVQARVHIQFDEEPWPDSGETIDLLLLRRLYVSNAEVLSYLRAPAVQELCHYLEEDEGPDLFVRHLEAFVTRSRCALRRLSLAGTPATHTTTEIIQKCPSVSELTIITDSVNADGNATETGNALISLLTIANPTGSVLAPQLSAIYFGCRNESYIDYNLYLQMLRSRWNAEGCALKSAALITQFGPKAAPEVRSGLDVLHQDGLEISLLEGRVGWDRRSRLLGHANGYAVLIVAFFSITHSNSAIQPQSFTGILTLSSTLRFCVFYGYLSIFELYGVEDLRSIRAG
ncbi:hypothetical protein DFH09DRAFT_1281234 [Mycena vulgaris]|nr:hypothetical protein DFH09DRAFT_1281234 [Mycena vulgaris]